MPEVQQTITRRVHQKRPAWATKTALKKLRAKGLSLKDIAEECGISRARVSQLTQE